LPRDRRAEQKNQQPKGKRARMVMTSRGAARQKIADDEIDE
jgi:hypothetical protein